MARLAPSRFRTEKSASRQKGDGSSTRFGIPLDRLGVITLLGLLTSCELLPTIAPPSNTVSHELTLRADTLLTHGPSGIKFAPQVGALHRRGTSKGVDQRPTISVLYRHTDLESQGRGEVKFFLHAIVNVVPASAATPDKLRAMARSKIEKSYPDASQETISGPHGEADYLVFSRDRSEFTDHLTKSKAAFAASYPSGVELHAFQRGDYTVLYQFDFSSFKHADFTMAINGFMKKFEALQELKVAPKKDAPPRP